MVKSRFPDYKKCRQGGAGAQTYMYKNIAIKARPEEPLPLSPPLTDLCHTYTLPLPNLCHYTLPQNEACDTSHHVPSMTEDQNNVAWTSTLLDTTSPPRAKRKVGHAPNKFQEDVHRVEEETELSLDQSATLYSPQGAAVCSDAIVSSNETTQMQPVNFSKYGNKTMLSRYSNILDESCLQTEPEEDLSVKSTRSPKNIPAHSEEKRPIPMDAEAEPPMAVGRKWVDANIMDVTGARTFAWEVMAAYTRDHPDQPLSETSVNIYLVLKKSLLY